MAKPTIFSALLSQLLGESKQPANEIVRLITKNDQTIKISYPAFMSYKNFDTVPSYEKAKTILDYFNYKMTEDELAEVLTHSRTELKKIKESEAKTVRQGVRLSPSYFGVESADDLSVIIQRRITDLYKEDGSMNTYISDLIKRDLKDSGYIK